MQIRFALIASLLVLALSGCGREEPATPLSLVPESAMVSVVVTEPVTAVRNIDSYIAAGAPFLGTASSRGKPPNCSNWRTSTASVPWGWIPPDPSCSGWKA